MLAGVEMNAAIGEAHGDRALPDRQQQHQEQHARHGDRYRATARQAGGRAEIGFRTRQVVHAVLAFSAAQVRRYRSW